MIASQELKITKKQTSSQNLGYYKDGVWIEVVLSWEGLYDHILTISFKYFLFILDMDY